MNKITFTRILPFYPSKLITESRTSPRLSEWEGGGSLIHLPPNRVPGFKKEAFSEGGRRVNLETGTTFSLGDGGGNENRRSEIFNSIRETRPK
jgi:hypothetical protein